MASGELRLDPDRLALAFGRRDLRLQTEDGVSLAAAMEREAHRWWQALQKASVHLLSGS